MYNIVFLGPPGSGKGTQSERVCEKLGIPHISTGDLFRGIMSKGDSKLAEEIKSYINVGQLVPDDIVVKLVKERIEKDDCKDGYLLDGFPRSLPQAQILDEMLADEPLTHVILIDVDESLIVKRLTGRRIAKNSGRIYNIYFNPPKEEGKCDETGEALIIRDDDTEETVLKRLKVYAEQTMPSVNYYKEKNILSSVNGEKGIDDVFSDIMEVLKA